MGPGGCPPVCSRRAASMRLTPGCTCPAQEEELGFHLGVSCSLRPSPGAHPCPFLRNPGACLALSSSDQSSSLKASLGFLQVRASGWPLASLCPQGAHTALLATSGCAGPLGGAQDQASSPYPARPSLSLLSQREPAGNSALPQCIWACPQGDTGDGGGPQLAGTDASLQGDTRRYNGAALANQLWNVLESGIRREGHRPHGA